MTKNIILRMKTLNKLGRACEYSPDGQLIAVGMKDGSVLVVKSDTFEEIKEITNRTSEISDVKFSPGI